jgi:hypothetical protein
MSSPESAAFCIADQVERKEGDQSLNGRWEAEHLCHSLQEDNNFPPLHPFKVVSHERVGGLLLLLYSSQLGIKSYD